MAARSPRLARLARLALPAPVALLVAMLAGCAMASVADRSGVDRGEAPVASPAKAVGPEAPRARLAALAARLATYGSGASISWSRAGDVQTVVAGTRSPDGPPVESGTRFSVQSVSKLFTAARIVALADAGALSVDDPINKWLPGVALVDADGRDRASELTLRDLLHHRSGLPRGYGDLDPKAAGTDYREPTFYDRMTRSWTIALQGPQGTYAYSNVGYGLLGAIIEKVDGCAFPACMAPVLRDLGLPTATFDATTAPDGMHGKASWKGQMSWWAPEDYMSYTAAPYGGLFVSTPELVRFGQVLNEASREGAHPLHAMTEAVGEWGHLMGPVQRTRAGHRSLEHDGAGPGALAWLIAIPSRDVVLAVSCNGWPPDDGAFGEVVDAALAVLLD